MSDATTPTPAAPAPCTFATPCSAECARNSWYGCRKAQTAPKYSPAARELAAYHADIYTAKRNARVAKKGGLR